MHSFTVAVDNFRTTVQANQDMPTYEVLRMAANAFEKRARDQRAERRRKASEGVAELCEGFALPWLPIATAPRDLDLRIIAGIFDANGTQEGTSFVTFHLPASNSFYLDPTHWFPRPIPPRAVGLFLPVELGEAQFG